MNYKNDYYSSYITDSPAITYNINNEEENIYKQITELFEKNRYTVFEDGMESDFSIKLSHLIKRGGNDVIDAISSLIMSGKINSEAAAESLIWLAVLDDPHTYHKRLWFLEHSLNLPYLRIRDRGVIGLSYLNDARAIPFLLKAIENERYDWLKKYMQKVLEFLKSGENANAILSEKNKPG